MNVKHPSVPAPTDVSERVKRTMLQTAVPALIVLVGLLPEVLQVVLDELGEFLPEHFRLMMVGVAAVLAAVSGAVTRIMAIPGVNDWLSRYTPFGTAPPAEARALRAEHGSE